MTKEEQSKEEQNSNSPNRGVEEEEEELISPTDFSKALNEIEILFSKNKLFLKPSERSLGILADIQEEEVEIPIDNLRKALLFYGRHLHYLYYHIEEKLEESYPKEQAEHVKELKQILVDHPLFSLLFYRLGRYGNFINGKVMGRRLSLNAGSKEREFTYFDISIPYTDQNENDKVLRIELDITEMESLVKSLQRIMSGEGDMEN